MNGTEINYISLSEAAKLTNYSQDYISLLCRQRKIKGVKMGRNWVTTKEWIREYIDKTKGKGEIVIPVKIKAKNHAFFPPRSSLRLGTAAEKKTYRAFSPQSSRQETAAGQKEHNQNASFFPAKKLMLASVIASFFIAGSILSYQGVIKPEAIVEKAAKTISGNSIDAILNYGENAVAAFSNSLDIIKGESAKFATGKIITASNSLNIIKNESTEFAIDKIISLDSSLSVIGNNANKKSVNEMTDSLKSQNDSIKPGLAPVANSITHQNSLSRGGDKDIFGGGFAGNRTPKTSVLTRISSHSEPTADSLYQNGLKGSNFESVKYLLSQKIVTLSNSLNLIKNKSTEFAANKIIALSNSLNGVKNKTASFAGDSCGKIASRLGNGYLAIERFAANVGVLYGETPTGRNRFASKIHTEYEDNKQTGLPAGQTDSTQSMEPTKPSGEEFWPRAIPMTTPRWKTALLISKAK